MSLDRNQPLTELKSKDTSSGQREVRFEHSHNLASALERANATLLISTYQAGKLVVVARQGRQISLSFHNYDRPMGVAAKGNALAVACKNEVWLHRNARDIAGQIQPAGKYDACYLARSCQVTGEIQSHEVAWIDDQLWVVNTLFSCLCTLAPNYNFVPRWQPPFVSGLAPQDRCHLNGLAADNEGPKYVTAMAESDEPGGWRKQKSTGGCLIHVATGEIVVRGLAMPHSPRLRQDDVWLLNSGYGQLNRFDPASGELTTMASLPGYTRGLAMTENLAFVGLSKIRETSTFSGVPIAEDRERLKCGVAVVDVSTGEQVSLLEFKSGVDEIFDVQLVSNIQLPALRGPFSLQEGEPSVWTVPEMADRRNPPESER